MDLVFNCLYMIVLGVTKLNIEPYDEDEGTGELRYVQVLNEINKQKLK